MGDTIDYVGVEELLKAYRMFLIVKDKLGYDNINLFNNSLIYI